MGEQLGPFEELERAVTAARAALRRAEDADQAARRVRYEAGLVKAVAETSYMPSREVSPAQRAIQLAMAQTRDEVAERLAHEARKGAIQGAARALDELRALIPHLVVPAVVDLGGRAGALRNSLAFPADDEPPVAEEPEAVAAHG